MRFTEFLTEAPVRDAKGRYIKNQPQIQTQPPQPANKPAVYKPRGKMVNGQFVPTDSVDFKPDPNVAPVQPANQGKANTAGDSVDFNPDPNQEPAQPKNKPAFNLKQIIDKAGVDHNAGREFISLLGAMYQAKRRNPNVQLELPKMVTTLPEKTEDEKKLKQQMNTLFNMSKDKTLPELAAMSKQIQDSRMNIIRQNGGRNLPPKQQDQPQQAPAGADQQQAPETQSLLQQLTKLPLQGLKAVGKKAKDLLRNKRMSGPQVQNVGQKPQVVSTG